MPAISFQPRWRRQLENGLDLIAGRPMRHKGVEPKLQTLRRLRKHPFKAGDRLYLWELQRRPEGQFIGVADCLFTVPVCVSCRRAGRCYELMAGLGERGHRSVDADLFARRDGFESIGELVHFLRRFYGLPIPGEPFDGVLISWDPRRPWEIVE